MAPSEDAKWIIRTSDRISFKNCRLQWDWGSKLRQNYEPNTVANALTFGTGVHAGMEALYDPRTWGQDAALRLAMAQTAFFEAYPNNGDVEEYAEYTLLGQGMLKHYIEWAADWDKTITPVHTEIEFEVPIPAPTATPLRFDNGIDGNLFCDGMPVVYQGRLDLIVQDQYGRYWIVDWKTAARIEGSHEWLQLDEQITSYCWAIQQMLGIRVEGFIYVELLKNLPEPPRVLKKGNLSVDKTQNTTHKLYLDKLAEMGYADRTPYEEILEYLRLQGNKFFRRTIVYRSQRELELMGERIALEAVDMLNDPSIYPTPNKFKCGFCAFKAPCLARADGSDYGWMLSDSFHKRGNDNA